MCPGRIYSRMKCMVFMTLSVRFIAGLFPVTRRLQFENVRYETELRSPVASGPDPGRGTVAACLRGLQRTAARTSPVPLADRARGPARADAGAADRGRRRLSSARQPRRGADPAGLCLPVGRHHRGAGGADRTRAGGAARSDQPARPGDPGRRTAADRRARGGAWRSDRAVRRRPGACRRAAAGGRAACRRTNPC